MSYWVMLTLTAWLLFGIFTQIMASAWSVSPRVGALTLVLILVMIAIAGVISLRQREDASNG